MSEFRECSDPMCRGGKLYAQGNYIADCERCAATEPLAFDALVRLLARADQLLMFATVGRGMDAIEYDAKVRAWQRDVAEYLPEEGLGQHD